MDEILGKLISLYSNDRTTMLIISDHGSEANPSHGSKGSHEISYSGYHENSPDGIFVISGMDIEKKAKLMNPTVLDIMPTLLALMGLPVGEDMSGKVLKNAINKSFFASHPVEKIPSYSSGWEHSSTPIESENVKTLKEKLKALGYIN
jgi:arylsulfatase A-like enzyme